MSSLAQHPVLSLDFDALSSPTPHMYSSSPVALLVQLGMQTCWVFGSSFCSAQHRLMEEVVLVELCCELLEVWEAAGIER